MKTITEPGKQVDELAHAGIPVERQKEIGVSYKGRTIGKHRLDLLVGGCLLVELKAVEELAEIHKAQVISYLKTTRLLLGLLINFNVPILRNGIQRVVYTEPQTVRVPGFQK